MEVEINEPTVTFLNPINAKLEIKIKTIKMVWGLILFCKFILSFLKAMLPKGK